MAAAMALAISWTVPVGLKKACVLVPGPLVSVVSAATCPTATPPSKNVIETPGVISPRILKLHVALERP
jgi:hypothetical protein